MNPSAALQTVVEDFLDSLAQTPTPTQAELINCILRACGCNHSVDGDEAVDYDGIVDALDNITEALKQDDTPIYPLTSKLPAFKPFRASLSEFLSRLISSAAAMGQIYSTDLMTTLQAWVVAMSSSQLRSFRHTATVVALEVETSMCEVAASVEKEAEVVSRQKEGERKRKKGRGEPATAREKELDNKAAEIRERRTQLAEFLKEFVDGSVPYFSIRYLRHLTNSVVSLSIDTATSIRIFELNVSVPWAFGSPSILHTFSMGHTCDMLDGSCPIRTLWSAWKQ